MFSRCNKWRILTVEEGKYARKLSNAIGPHGVRKRQKIVGRPFTSLRIGLRSSQEAANNTGRNRPFCSNWFHRLTTASFTPPLLVRSPQGRTNIKPGWRSFNIRYYFSQG